MEPEFTLFTTTKPFVGTAARVQRNTLWSWTRLPAEVIVVGDDEGAPEACQELGVQMVAEVRRHNAKAPYVSDVWRIGQASASTDLCVFSNADVIFVDDLAPALAAVRKQADGPFLVVGQRWDLELDEDITGSANGWDRRLRERARANGTLNSPIYIDWFAFLRGTMTDLPDFTVGRPPYDHWLVGHALRHGMSVVDATEAVTPVHQHHDYASGGGFRAVYQGADAQRNLQLAGGRGQLRTIGNATHMLGADLVLRPAQGAKYTLGRAQVRLGPVLEATKHVRQRVGLNAEALQRLSRRRPAGARRA